MARTERHQFNTADATVIAQVGHNAMVNQVNIVSMFYIHMQTTPVAVSDNYVLHCALNPSSPVYTSNEHC